MVTTGLIGTGVEGKKESDTQQNGFETNIETRDVQVSPRNIQVINDRQVIVVNSGGTQTNIPLSTLTRTQAMQLAQ